MIPPLQAVRRILWGNVELEGKKIPVIKRTYPYDKTPCITIDDSGGSTFIKRLITNEEYPLPSNHPQYNPETPFKKQKQQVLREYFQTTLNIKKAVRLSRLTIILFTIMILLILTLVHVIL